MSALKTGFIGLGLMGSGFTERLIKQGFQVIGYDSVAEKVAAAEELGVTGAASAADVAMQSDQTHVCVMTAQQLDDVVFGPKGIGSVDVSGKVLIDHSTTPVDTTRDMANRLFEKTGMHWIDAPVSGGPAAARGGSLAIMAGGSEAAFTKAMPVLQQLGQCTHMGDVGTGQVTKMVNQILVLNNYCILAEALALAEAGGVDAGKIPHALAQGHAGSNLLQRLYPRMLDRDFEPAGYAFQVLKDLDMVHDLAKSLSVPTPMSAQAANLFRMLNNNGHGDLDGISVLKLYDTKA